MSNFCSWNLIPVCCLLLSASFIGATPCKADDSVRAKKRFQEGVALFASEDYSGALEAFEESYRLSPKVLVQFNKAMCYKALYRYADAIKTFEQFLDGVEERAHRKKVSWAKDALNELEELVGKLTILEAPDNARLSINDKVVGMTPFRSPLNLDPGRYHIDVSKPGFESLSTNITVVSGAQVRLRAVLTPLEETASGPVELAAPLAAEQTGEPMDGEEEGGASALLISSIITGGLGIIAAGVGGYFIYERERDIQELDDANNAAEWNETAENATAREPGIAMAFVASGVLLTSAVILFVLDQAEDGGDNAVVKSTKGGVAIRF